jgi:gliding motility-associated protein GldE
LETVACLLVTLNSTEFILQSPFAIPILLIVLALLLLALISVSGAELAFLSLPTSSKAVSEQKDSKSGKKLVKLLSNPEKFMATLVVANVFIKVGLIVISFFLAFNLIQPGTFSDWLFICLLILAVLSVILFCELTPKIYAIAKPEKYLLTTGPWIYLLQKIFNPIVAPFQKAIFAFNQKFIGFPAQISVNDLTEAFENSSDQLSEEEEILKGIIKFGAIDVSEILRPRIDVVAVDLKMSLKQVLTVVVDSGYSRIPVYAGNFDNVKGILFVKDLLPHINEKDDFHWQSLIRPPYFVPDTKKVKELLAEFQTSKIHLAVIVDEYGGTLGIVTLEDILEEIVGEISDESDEDEKSYTQINRNTYIFDGKTLLNDFYKILQIETTVFEDIKGDADTLAGLILELKGAIPAKNEQIKYKQFTFKIESVDLRRIKQLRVTINNL